MSNNETTSRVTRTCLTCGKEKAVSPSHSKRAKNFNCSMECAAIFRKNNKEAQAERNLASGAGIQKKYDEDRKWAEKRKRTLAKRAAFVRKHFNK